MHFPWACRVSAASLRPRNRLSADCANRAGLQTGEEEQVRETDGHTMNYGGR